MKNRFIYKEYKSMYKLIIIMLALAMCGCKQSSQIGDEVEIVTWKPNPNAKEVYKPYDYNSEQYKAYKQQCEYI